MKRQIKLEEMITTSSKKKTKKKDDENERSTEVKKNTKTSSTEKKISNDDLEVLKQFDLDMTFGPCTGIPRLDRYERALRHDLDPPIRVYELINLYPNDRQVTHCIWRDYTL